VTAGAAGIPEPILDEIRPIPGIRAAVPVIEAVVHTTDAGQGNILILGVDMAGDQSMRDYKVEGDEEVISDPPVFLARPENIIISREFASKNGLTQDSRICLVTALGPRNFAVRGIMRPKGMAKAFGGNIGLWMFFRRSSSSAADRDSTASTLR
jgi:hypothetical protein